ncbi:MAG: histidine kinase, partial [Chitinophagaceae bacterium]
TNNIDLEKMELGTNRFTFYEHGKLANNPSFAFGSYRDENNLEWLLGDNSAYYYDSVAKENVHSNLNVFPANAHRSSYIVSDSINNTSWVATYERVLLFNKKTKKVYSENFNPIGHPLLDSSYGNAGRNLRFIMMDSKQNIWISGWGDFLYRYDNGTKKISKYSLGAIKAKENVNRRPVATPLINCILEDDNQTIWIGTENAGLLRYNPAKDNFDYCIAQEKNSESIQYDYKIFSLFQDREQNIWIGTDKGISIFNPYRQYFKSIRYETNSPLSIGKSEIISFIQVTKGDMFIGTWGGGVAVYDSWFNFKKNILFKGLSGTVENDDARKVWSFQQVDEKTLWMGCQHGRIIIYNLLTGAIQSLQPPEMEESTIRCMEKDDKGNLWFGLNNGKISKWDKKKNKFFAYGAGLQDSLKISSIILNIFIDRSQRCWVSTLTGFKEFDLEKRIYINTWLPDKNDVSSISGKTCHGIEEYNDSILLIGTAYGGINFFNKRTRTFSNLGTAEGLPSNTIFAIKKGAAGYIWFTTDYGLYKFNPTEKKINSYSMDPGVIRSSFVANNFYPLQDGQWLTFTAAEAISFFPRRVEYQDNRKPEIEITGFKLFNKPVHIDSLLFENKPLRLSYKKNFFTVEFAALNFSSLHQINYYYRLSGVDKDWVQGGTNRFANYTDLQPGEYIFEVKAESGNLSGETTSFKIIIAPPFWKRWWFISILSVCVLLLIYLFIKWREKNIKAIEEEKLKVQQLNAEQYKSKLELEQIINYFSSSLIDKNTVDDVLWDVANNLIGRLGFVDCIMYLWNEDKTTMIQRAGYGVKGSIEAMNKLYFDVVPGQGVVGYVMQAKEPVLIPDTSKDTRYRPDEMTRLSEITVPVIYNNELIGIIDSEHHEKNFFTHQHVQVLSTIATLMATKIKSIEAEQSLQRTNIEMYSMNEQLSKAKLEALRSQMNPHFIFNCINSIDALIQSNDKYHATVYLNKFAKLIRNILDSSKQDTVPLSKDLDTLKLYIELEQLRHENKFTAEINADEAVLQDDYKVPPLIIQPFVENAILHGIRYRTDNNGKLTISVIKLGDYLQYVIEDNGVGRGTFRGQVQKEKISYGMDMTNERVKLFNHEEKASVRITDLFEQDKPAGTKVEVLLIIQ